MSAANKLIGDSRLKKRLAEYLKKIHVGAMSQAEAARRLGCSVQNVSYHYHKTYTD